MSHFQALFGCEPERLHSRERTYEISEHLNHNNRYFFQYKRSIEEPTIFSKPTPSFSNTDTSSESLSSSIHTEKWLLLFPLSLKWLLRSSAVLKLLPELLRYLSLSFSRFYFPYADITHNRLQRK